MATQRTGQSATAELLDCYVKATRLIIEMFEDPERTYGSGPALLQCCRDGYRLDRYVALVEQLDNPGESIRKHAAFLVGNGGAAQRDVARRYFEQLGRPEDANRWGAARQLP